MPNITKRPQSEDLLRKNHKLKQMKKLDPIDTMNSNQYDEFEVRPALTERKINNNSINSNSISFDLKNDTNPLSLTQNSLGMSSFKINNIRHENLSRTKSMVNQDLKINNTRSRNFKNDEENENSNNNGFLPCIYEKPTLQNNQNIKKQPLNQNNNN
jgi:hypothetical protein